MILVLIQPRKSIKNLKIIKSFIIIKTKNLGAGKSFEIGIDIFNKIGTNYLLKIDGDNQFSEDDILYLAKKGEDENYDFIKCDRFWEGGIKEHSIYKILRECISLLFYKTNNRKLKINDPLNGLFFISKCNKKF